MTPAARIAKVIRKHLPNPQPAGQVGVALSGGVDSCSVLASLLLQGVEPVLLSYSPDTHESTDLKYARRTAANTGLPLVEVRVSMEPEDLYRDVKYVVELGFKTKLEAESMTPMVSIAKAAMKCGVTTLYTGDQSDGFYINNNWMSRNFDRARGIPGYLRTHVKDDSDPWRIDELRRIYWEEDRSCSGAIAVLVRSFGVGVSVPYRNPLIYKAFKGTLWSDVNLPRLKEPVHLAYEADWAKFGIETRPLPVNLHRGDSMFAEMMGARLMKMCPGPWRTTTGLYSAMARGEV